MDAAAPFDLGSGPDACLLLHGLTGAPSEVRPVGEALALAGIRAVGPLLPGHGTRPQDLARVRRGDLLEAAAAVLAALGGCRRVYVCGLSAGALLTLLLCARKTGAAPQPAAIALLAPAARFAGPTWAFVEILGRLPSLPLLVDKGLREVSSPLQVPAPVDAPHAPSLPPRTWPDGSYTAVPLSWARELRKLSREALAAAPLVDVPALLLHGERDRTAAPAGSRLLARRLGSRRVLLRAFPESGHVLPLDRDAAEVARAVVSFFQEA